MRIQRSFYEVMGLDNTASQAEVKAKYHALARLFHPDRAKDKVLAQRHFTQINLAYRTLSDVQRRTEYDASLSQAAVSVGRGAPGQGHPDGQRHPQPKTDPVAQARTEPIKPGMPRPNLADPSQPQLTIEQALQKANAAYMGGDRRTAQQLCQNIIRADSGNAAAHLLLGDIYSDLGQRVDALTEYRTAVNAGDHSRLLQEKIKRMETTQSSSQVKPGGSAPGQRPPPTPAPQARPKKPDPPKKGNLFDRLIGRGK